MKTPQFNSIFMSLMLILGLVLVYISWDTDAKLIACGNQTLKNANKILLVLGTAMVAFSIAYFRVSLGYECLEYDMTTYLVMITILGIILIVLGAVITANSKGTCVNTGGSNIVWILGTFMVVLCAVVFYLNRQYIF